MSKKEIPNDKSSSYMITVTQKDKKDRYYMAQLLFSTDKYMEQWEVDEKGYYLFVVSVDYDKENNKVLNHNILFSELKLLVSCSRRNEKKFNLAIDMLEEEAKKLIEVIEQDRDDLEKKGLTEEEVNDFFKIFQQEYEKEKTKEKSGMRYVEPKKEAVSTKNELVKVEDKPKRNKITFDDVAGMEDVKEVLLDVIDQFNNPERYEYFDIEPIKSVLLYGSPGCGKTFIAEAFANECNAKFVKISLGEIGSKYQNATGNNVKRIFDEARRERGKVILMLDEVDSIAVKRGDSSNDKEKNNTLNVLLTEMCSEENKNIFILCATNFYELLDPAFTRSGRCDIKIKIPLPNEETRLQILKLNTKRKPLGDDIDLQDIAMQMEGSNCADVSLVCNQSARIALKKNKMEINQEDFLEALEKLNMKKKEESVRKIGFSL